MLLLKILMIAAIVLAVLFILSLIIYFFNLDMKLAASLIPVLNLWYDRGEKKRAEKKAKDKKK